MKRYLNYLLLASNFVITIVIAILLAIFIKESNNSNNATIIAIYNKFANYMWLIIVASLAGIGLFCVYIFFLRKELKNTNEVINPRLVHGLIYSGVISFVNFIIPVVLAFIGMYTVNVQETLWMLGFAFGISGLVGLFIAGFTSYFNLRISWANVKREQLRAEAATENVTPHETTQDIKDKTKNKASDDKNTDATSTIDQPTSGSF